MLCSLAPFTATWTVSASAGTAVSSLGVEIESVADPVAFGAVLLPEEISSFFAGMYTTLSHLPPWSLPLDVLQSEQQKARSIGLKKCGGLL